MNALVFHARGYNFTGKDGRQVIGNSVSYLEAMDPVRAPDEQGLPPMSIKATDDALGELLKAQLPALFSIEVGRRAGRDGRPDSFITSAKFLRPVPVDGLLGLAK